jgi:hypothetical protein
MWCAAKSFPDKQAEIIHVMDRPSLAPDETIFTEHESPTTGCA